MSHQLLAVMADVAIFTLVVLLPLMWIVYTVQLHGMLEPRHYATLFLLVGGAGVLLFLPAISIIAATALLALLLAWLCDRYALDGLSYQRTLDPPRLFCDDEAELAIRFRNAKLLPLAWVSITDPIWLGVLRGRRTFDELLHFSEGIKLQANFDPALLIHGAIGPFQELVRTYRVRGLQRGIYTLGPATVESGDPFGFFRRATTLGGRQEIVVYPRIYRPDELGLPFREAMGELVARRALLEDPTLIAGSREYQPGDPVRRMHWKATARRGDLQVRVSDPSTTAQLMIVLNLSTFRAFWQGMGIDRMEEAIRVGASLAVWGLQHGFAVGLHSNGVIGGAASDEDAPRIPPSAHPRQATVLLEHLARVTFSGRFPAEYVLLNEARRLGPNASILFVTPIITPELIAVLTSRQLTERVSVVYCGSFAAPVVRGVPIHLVTPPRETIRAVS